MGAQHPIPSFCLLVLLIVPFVWSQAVDVALRKPIKAWYTCGVFGTERYNTLRDATRFGSAVPTRLCYNSNSVPAGSPLVAFVHPPSYMVDGDPNTWWQSTSRFRTYQKGVLFRSESADKLEAIIDLNLEQEFLVETITIQLGEALTPQRIAIMKSLDGLTFESWIFGVSNVDFCLHNFNVPWKNTPSNLTDVICIYYVADDVYPGDPITINIQSVANKLKEWTRVKYLKIKFYDMLFISPFNKMAISYNHYAVQALNVMAECPCNGHQIGCEINNVTQKYECICSGNTRGMFCENCMPLYNQQPFTFGQDCVECNCFNHADSCIYQTSVDIAKESLDMQGNYNGGGVCVECKHNTAGINCNQCRSLFYRPVGRLQTAVDACVHCACNMSGSTFNPSTGLRDCIMNNDVADPSGKQPGDCFCKTNVQGSKCDQCKVGFYNLDGNNEDGCAACGCYTPGTVGASDLCTSDLLGQCTCKANVQGRDCSTCKDGFYGLAAENINGCVPCDCDIGGAVDQVCDKLTGQCVCRNTNINGRACTNVASGYYFPTPHYVSAEVEASFGDIVWQRDQAFSGYLGQGYAVAAPGDSYSMFLDVPEATTFMHEYIMLVRYRSAPQNLDPMTVAITRDANDLSRSMDLTLPSCTIQWCMATSENIGRFNLSEGPNLMTLSVKTGEILLDTLTAVPVELANVDPSVGIVLPTGCDLLTNTLPTDPTQKTACEKAIFSLTMTYWGVPLQCNCDITGSTSSQCNLFGGQCDCQPNVVDRRCSTCAVGHFALTSTGCTACQCEAVSTVCDSLTGQCECPANTVGRQCETCLPNNWDWNQQLGCKACNCNPEGSASLQCNATTGTCMCKEGAMGAKCDECQDGYYYVTGPGCVPCACDPAGSASLTCNKTNGVCTCKSLVNGTKCDTCLPNTFGLHIGNVGGCLDCVCMGVTTYCTSSQIMLSQTPYPLVTPGVNGTLTPNLGLYTADGNPFTATTIDPTTGTDGTVSLTLNLETGQPRLYWKLPDTVIPTLLDLYGTTIEFSATYVIVSGLALTDANVLLKLADSTVYTHSVASFPQEVITTVSVQMMETAWVQSGLVATPLTRPQFLKALAQAQDIFIPASFSSGRHTVRLSGLSYGVQSTNGTVNTRVEQCVCGADYLGSSCQTCAPGLKRANVSTSEFLGVCVPCECNSHSTTCEPLTGVCTNCAHNTAGDRCELCAVGFYGDATQGTATDCSICPCFAPRVKNGTCEPVTQPDNTTVITCQFCQDGYEGRLCDSCSPFYYGNPQVLGGTCTQCNCNGNSDTCNPVTGICENCGFNTIGNNCDQCNVNFYGNVTQQTCANCTCLPDTSNATQCEAVTGQCQCAPGVTGRTCDSCMQGYWGFTVATFRGCANCGCVEAGSTSVQCDSLTGQCPCQPNTAGVTCDTCADGFYGLPLQSCQDCACNITGTQVSSACNKTDGQCVCQPGVTGRTCDQCLPFFVGFNASGCTECGQCQKSLGSNIDTLIVTADSVLTKSGDVLAIQEQDMRLVTVSGQLNTSLDSLGLAGNVTSLSDLVNQATVSLQSLQSDFSTTQGQMNALHSTLLVMQDSSSTELTRHTTMKETALHLDGNVTQFQGTMYSYVQRLSVYNNTASQYLTQGGNSSALTFNLDSELATAQALLANISDNSKRTPVDQEITNQATQIASLEGSASTLSTDVESQSVQLAQASDTLNQATFTSSVVEDAVDDGLLYKSQSEELETGLGEILTSAEAENSALQVALTNAQSSVTTTLTIYNGSAATVMRGENVPPFPLDVTNYQTGLVSLQNLVDSVPLLVDRVAAVIQLSEDRVTQLQSDLTALNDTYQAMDATGMEAVKSIDNYNEVVSDLDSAVLQSQQADTLIKQVSAAISGTALSALQTAYEQEANSSKAVVESYNTLDYQPSVLLNLLQEANTRLDNEPAQWTTVDTLLDSVTTSAQTLNTQMTGNNLATEVSSAQSQAQTAQSKSQSALNMATNQGDVVTQRESQLQGIQGQSATIDQLDASIQNKLSSHAANLQSYQSQSTQAASLKASTALTQDSITQKISDLETKLANLETMLTQLKQPVNFDGTLGLSLDNPDINVPHTSDDVTIEVKKPGDFTDGTILFIDAANSNAELEVGVSNDKFFMEFNAGNELVRVDSPAVVCADCWAKLYASRYLSIGHLTVQLMSSGGAVTASSVGQDVTSARTMLLTTPVYLGTLDNTTLPQPTKVAAPEFRGCIQSLSYQNTMYSLWSNVLPTGQQAGCCQGPQPLDPPVIITGVSFSGYSYTVLTPTIDFSQAVRLSMEVRPALLDSSLFTVISADGLLRYSISLKAGKVEWEIFTNSLPYTLTSQKNYTALSWIQIIASIESNTVPQLLRLTVNEVNNPQNGADVVTLDKPFSDLTSLNGQNLIFGADSDPLIPGYIPKATNYAGCMRNVQLTTSAVFTVNLNENVQGSVGVSTAGCYQSVIGGYRLGLTTSTMTLSLANQVTALRQVEITFVTEESKGILLYIHPVDGARYLYIAVFGGNVVLSYRQNNAASVLTSGQFVSDGQLHTLTVDCSTQRISMTLDGQVFEQPQQTLTSDFLSFQASALVFAGGVRSGITLPSDLPVTTSLAGSITSLKLNNVEILHGSITAHTGLSLAGVPTPPTVLPLPPIPNPHTLQPCAAVFPPTYLPLSQAALFTGNQSINWSSLTSGNTLNALLRGAFTFDIDFSTYKSNGVLLYAANSVSSPTQYVAVYILNGIITFSMRTSLGQPRTVTLSLAYNTGERTLLTAVRINDFMSMNVDSKKDTATNNQSPDTASELVIPDTSSVFIGGIGDNTLATAGLPAGLKTDASQPFFVGALYSLNIRDDPNTINLVLSDLNRVTFPAVPQTALYGVSIQSGTGNYLNLGLVSVPGQADIKFTLSTKTGTAIIFALFQLQTNRYIVLDTLDQTLRLHLYPSYPGITQPFMVELLTASGLCDGQTHTLELKLQSKQATISIDNGARTATSLIPESHAITSVTDYQFFVGGVYDPLSQILPADVQTGSLESCIQSVIFGSTTYDPTNSVSGSHGVSYSCPV